MFFSSVPLSRNVFLLISLGITIFVVSNIFIFDVYRPLALDLAQGNNTGDYRASLYRNDTLGIATRIYVVSLPKREDRRQGMEYLRRSLGLRWTYMEAIDGESPMVKKILRAVQLLRDTRSPNSAFQWPSFVPPLSEYMDPWSPGFLAPEDESDLHIPQPMHMTCATQNVTITPYRPDLPEYKILTPARVACWFSHLSVIQTIANDNTLRADDVVLVLEDDVNMERDIHVRLSKVWRLLPASWDIVYLGHCWSDESVNAPLNSSSSHVARLETGTNETRLETRLHPSWRPLCTHAYALSRSGARRVLLHLRYPPFAYSRSVDRALSWLVQSGRVRSFSVAPSVVVQRKAGRSDVMPGTGSGWRGTLVDGVFND